MIERTSVVLLRVWLVLCLAHGGYLPAWAQSDATAQVRVVIEQAQALLRDGQHQAALDRAKEAVEVAHRLPEATEARRESIEDAEIAVGTVYLFNGVALAQQLDHVDQAAASYRESLRWLHATRHGVANRVAALYLLGQLEKTLQQAASAAAHFDEAAGLDTDESPQGLSRRATVLAFVAQEAYRQGRVADAAQRLEQSATLQQRAASDLETAQANFALAGELRLFRQEYEAAAADFSQALGAPGKRSELTGSELARAYVEHGWALVKLQRWSEAREHLDRAERIPASSSDGDLAVAKPLLRLALERHAGRAAATVRATDALIGASASLGANSQWALSAVQELVTAGQWLHDQGDMAASMRAYGAVVALDRRHGSAFVKPRELMAQVQLRYAEAAMLAGEPAVAASNLEEGFRQLIGATADQLVGEIFDEAFAGEKPWFSEVLYWRAFALWAGVRDPQGMGLTALWMSAITKSMDDELLRAGRAADRRPALVTMKGELAGRLLGRFDDSVARGLEPEEPDAEQLLRNLKESRSFTAPVETALAEQIVAAEKGRGADAMREALLSLARMRPDDILGRLRADEALLDFMVVPEGSRFEPARPSEPSAEAGDGPHYAVALAKAGSRQVDVIDLGAIGGLDRRILVFHREYERQAGTGRLDEPALARLGRALSEDLLAEVLKRTPGVRRYYVAAVGPIANVPFGALPTADAAAQLQYLAEHTEWLYLTSSRDLKRFAQGSAPVPRHGSMLLVGDPQPAAQSRWPRMPGAAQLVDTVGAAARRSEFAATVLTGPAAREGEVKAAGMPLLLLFATHGQFLAETTPVGEAMMWSRDGGPLSPSALMRLGAEGDLRTMLLLADAGNRCGPAPSTCLFNSDGYLTAYEASELDLARTRLVVLLGCQTGLGGQRLPEGAHFKVKSLSLGGGVQKMDDDEPVALYNFFLIGRSKRDTLTGGSSGLRRAFEIAGARSLVASQWTIPLQPHSAAVTGFFDRWFADTSRPYAAFRQAELAAIREAKAAGRTHPFYWAGLVFVGDPGGLP